MEIVAPRRPRLQALLLATGTLLVPLITLLGAALRLYRLGALSGCAPAGPAAPNSGPSRYIK
jgi:hypothetical protein